MTPGTPSLFNAPNAHFLAFDGRDALFVDIDRAAYHQSLFLDRRAVADHNAIRRMSLTPLLGEAAHHSAPSTGWIFHIAHCGSTLLARLIDTANGALVLREPPPLRQLAAEAGGSGMGTDWQGRLRLAHQMSARRFSPELRTVVKANVPVNFILPHLHALEPHAPSILLHFALKPYLLAILRSAEHRTWVDRVTHLLQPFLRNDVALDQGAGTAERAAALWLAQMLAFDAALAANPNARSLDAEHFFAEPVETAQAAANHFGIQATALATNAAQMLGTYSKNPSQSFDETARQARQDADEIRLRPDLDIAFRWIDRSAAAKRLPECLAHPLVGTAPTLRG